MYSITDGFWILNTRPVSKRNTKIRALYYKYYRCLLSVNVLRKHMRAVKIFTGEGHGVANDESNSTANSSGRKFLYNSKGLDVISLLVKYYLPMAHINML